ncbi:serine O-acetyltransferase [Microbacterium luticocti]|uniref:serine O-acetyltransferase n=1 Tax=Microbacterium luticocti TaxID=451764 RepID=UPI000416F8EC|nr:serine acetyltransferase [Microbacterium luticocti]
MGDFAFDLHKAFAIRLGPHPSRLARLRLTALSSELHCVACHRFGQWARRLRMRRRMLGTLAVIVHRLWDRWVSHIDSAHISRNAQIGPGFLVMHQTGIVIGEGVIGANCTVHQNVTIGQGVAGGDNTVPTIGDNVWIGPGAIITGGITVGDGVTISAGTVLSRDVDAGSLVAGNPGRVIAQNYDNSEMLGFRMPPR